MKKFLKASALTACVAGLVVSGLLVAYAPLAAKALFVLAGGGCVKGIGDVTGING